LQYPCKTANGKPLQKEYANRFELIRITLTLWFVSRGYPMYANLQAFQNYLEVIGS
jgi:hypothetical protein